MVTAQIVFLHLMALSAATMSGFTFPTLHVDHTAIETNSHVVPTVDTRQTSFETVSIVVPTTRRTVHVTKTVMVAISTVASVEPTTSEVNHFVQSTQGAKTSEVAQSSATEETRHVSQSHSEKTSSTKTNAMTHSSSSATFRSSTVYPTSSFITKTSSWSTEPTPSETTTSTISGPSTDNTSSLIAIIFAVTVAVIVAGMYLCAAVWPRYRFRKAQKTHAQPSQRNWWVWRKRDRGHSEVSTRATDVEQVHHMTSRSPAVFGEHEGTVARSVRGPMTRTASLWPVRNYHVWPNPPKPIRLRLQGPDRDLPVNPRSSAFSFDTLDGELEATYVRQDDRRRYQPYVEDDVAQETQEAHLGPPPGRRVVNVEVRDRPVSQVASLGSDSDDEFEDLPLH